MQGPLSLVVHDNDPTTIRFRRAGADTRERLARRRAASRRDDRGTTFPMGMGSQAAGNAPFGRFVSQLGTPSTGTNQYRPALAH
jgi:hypothetical protein